MYVNHPILKGAQHVFVEGIEMPDIGPVCSQLVVSPGHLFAVAICGRPASEHGAEFERLQTIATAMDTALTALQSSVLAPNRNDALRLVKELERRGLVINEKA